MLRLNHPSAIFSSGVRPHAPVLCSPCVVIDGDLSLGIAMFVGMAGIPLGGDGIWLTAGHRSGAQRPPLVHLLHQRRVSDLGQGPETI